MFKSATREKLKRQPIEIIGPSIAYIQLTRGGFSLIDSEDLPKVGCYNWYLTKKSDTLFYATRRDNNKPNKPNVMINHMVFPIEENKIQDHINGNGLDNRKCNLRNVTLSENSINTRKRNMSTSNFKGVYKTTRDSKWNAKIQFTINGIDSEEEANKIYIEMAKQFHGKFRRLN